MSLSNDTSSPRLRMTMDGIMISHPRISPPPPKIRPMDIRCQCSSIRLRTPTPLPLAVYHCHCRECRRQSSTAYGTSAVYPVEGVFPLSPELKEKLSVYVRPGERSRSGRDMACFFCSGCGARVMHRYLKRRRPSTSASTSTSTSTAGTKTKPSADDGTGCGGGGDLGGSDSEEEEADTNKTTTATDDTADGNAPSTDTPSGDFDFNDESIYDGTTLTIKGGLIAGLDYSQAIHIYTEQAVVPIPEGVKRYPGTPTESP